MNEVFFLFSSCYSYTVSKSKDIECIKNYFIRNKEK